MKSDEPSRMALMVARQRAAHQLLDHGAILDDPYAVRILGEDEDNILQAFNDHPLRSLGRLFTAARSRIAEDALSKAVERGVRQVVILGVGLDTFALRNPHADRISIFEVDHPATQAWKRQRLVGLNSRLRHGSPSCPSISSGMICRRSSAAPASSAPPLRFSLGSASCPI